MNEVLEGVLAVLGAVAVMTGAVFLALFIFHLWDRPKPGEPTE